MTIQSKIILLATLTLLITGALLGTNAFILFRDNSLNEVYTSTTLISQTAGNQIQDKVNSLMNQFKELGSFIYKQRSRKKIKESLGRVIKANHPVKGLIFFTKKNDQWHALYNRSNQSPSSLTIPFQEIATGKHFSSFITTPSGKSELLLATPWIVDMKGQKKSNGVIAIFISPDFFKLKHLTKPYEMWVITEEGEKVFSTKQNDSNEQLQTNNPLSIAIKGSQLTNKFISYSDSEGQEWLGAYQKIWFGKLALVVQIPKARAFQAANSLIYRTFLITLLIVGLFAFATYLFTIKITKPLLLLANAAKEMAKGNFNTPLQIHRTDEIGNLSVAFNKMQGQINQLIKDTADKARMENELKTAQLVQNTLFPDTDITLGPLSVASFYEPASECGGDFWGTIPLPNNQAAIIISDAMGHGAPAALIATAVKSCCSAIEFGALAQEEALRPSQIVDIINKAIYQATKGKFHATLFAGIFDFDSGMLLYSNASHNEPIIYQVNAEKPDEISKQNLSTLHLAKGKRVGEDQNSVYTDANILINPDDTLVFYTDGIVERMNKKEKVFGTGKFIRGIIKTIALSPRRMVQSLIDLNKEFAAGAAPDDDLTLVVARLHRKG